MNAMLVNNRIPGFLPIAPRPMAIASRVPPRQRFSPPAFRPPIMAMSVEESPKMGQSFALSQVPSSVAFAAAGVAGIVLSGVAPSPFKEILMAAGVGVIGWGVVNLFSGPETQKPPERPAGGEQVPQVTPSESAFRMIKGTIISPTEGSKPNLNFWGTSYDASVIWYNPSIENVAFAYDVYADVKVPGLPTAQVTPGKSVYTGNVTLKPKQDSGPVTITLPIVQPSQPFESFGATPQFWNELTLRKYDSRGVPVPVFGPIRIGTFLY